MKGSRDALELLEKLRNCQRNGFTIDNVREELHRIDRKRAKSNNFRRFYDDTLLPFKKILGVPLTIPDKPTVETLIADLPVLKQLVNKIMFYDGNGVTYATKSKIYRTYNTIEQTVNAYSSYAKLLEDLLRTRLFGLIINKAAEEEADSIAGEFVERIADTFSLRMTYLGSIPEEKALRNISNYQMPFIIYNHEHPVLDYFYEIADKIIGLKSGSTAKIIIDLSDYIASLKMRWAQSAERVSSLHEPAQ